MDSPVEEGGRVVTASWDLEHGPPQRADAMSPYALGDAEKARFRRDGFVGPFPAFLPPDKIAELRCLLADIEVRRMANPIYGRFSVRDWHLIDARVAELFSHPAIVERLRGLAGDDLVLWRSKIFHKKAGDTEIGWHQEWGLFNGEEIGNDKPALTPRDPSGDMWNLTVWVALCDVTPTMGPLQFIRGSHRRRYPISMVPLDKSAFFFDDTLEKATDARELARMCKERSLVVDIDTSEFFTGVDVASLSSDEAKSIIFRELSRLRGAVTLPFEYDPQDLVTVETRAGEFVIFSERTMHGSPPNRSAEGRTAVNCRVTTSDTLIYPGRLRGDFTDGSNIDIRTHFCILLSGDPGTTPNVFGSPPRERFGPP